jgi:mannose-6-phosphate isomerase-like protein (cupin superfamily)
MHTLTKGPAMVFGPDDGDSYWQPTPHSGYMNVTVSPRNHPSNQFSMGTQVIPPGRHVRSHAHARNDEVIFVYSGTGRCVIDGKSHSIEQGSTVLLGRYVEHSIHNEGTEDLKFFWLFTPPGLEHAVEYMGRPRTPGEVPPTAFERPADFARILDKAGYATPEEVQAARAV